MKKKVSLYECPTDKGMIIVDEDGHEYHDAGDGCQIDYDETIDKALRKYNLELCVNYGFHKTNYIAIKPVIKKVAKMDILKIVLTALSIKVEKYLNKIVKFVEQNK